MQWRECDGPRERVDAASRAHDRDDGDVVSDEADPRRRRPAQKSVAATYVRRQSQTLCRCGFRCAGKSATCRRRAMECPKCGRAVEAGAFICPACEFILDTSFLGDDITDDDRDARLQKQKRGDRGSLFGEDAIILGDGGDGEWSDFSARDAGMQREVTQARFY